jgi:PAS domain S-box-containing protein
MLHRDLLRQLREQALDPARPPEADNWQRFLEGVSRTYDDGDRELHSHKSSITQTTGEMRELNERLVWERDHFAAIFQSVPMAMIRIELDGKLSEVNEAFEEVVGRTRIELVGRPFWEIAHPDDKVGTRALLLSVEAGLFTSGVHPIRLVSQANQSLFTNVGLALVRDQNGHPQCCIAVVENVTDKNRLEIELRHAQKLESVGRLAAGIAHEINTPIQFVGDNVRFLCSAFSDLLALGDSYRALCTKARAAALSAADLEELAAAERQADLEYVTQNVPTAFTATLDGVDRVAHIVHSMKSFAHPDRGKRGMADLNAALRSTLTIASSELKYVADVEESLGPVPPVPCILSDLNQVFLNLLMNAAHAIADAVGASGRRGTIGVRTYQEGQQVVISVSDSGTGIPVEVRDKIFDPFFTTKEVGRGTGQGLALARSVVVDQHHGTLSFETEIGKGTTFFVRLPLSVPALDEAAAD